MVFIPLFTYGFYPLLGRWFEVTPLRKIGIGLFLTAIVVCDSIADSGEHRRGRCTAYHVANARLCRDDSGRGHGFDHWPGVLLHAGPTKDEVVRDGRFLSLRSRPAICSRPESTTTSSIKSRTAILSCKAPITSGSSLASWSSRHCSSSSGRSSIAARPIFRVRANNPRPSSMPQRQRSPD